MMCVWICVVLHVKDVLLEQINLGWFMAMEEKLSIVIIKCCLSLVSENLIIQVVLHPRTW